MWELDRLTELALAFVERSPEHWVRLDIQGDESLRAEFFHGARKLGAASVGRCESGMHQGQFQLHLGAEGTEQSAASVPHAVQLIASEGNS